MTLRRYVSMKPSRGTAIPASLRAEVYASDQGCVGPIVGMPGECQGAIELDHVRASHGTGMKSETTRSNLVSLCSGGATAYGHHRLKTEHGRTWRPALLAYIERRDS